MIKIDIHNHILPREWPNLHEKYGAAGFPYIEHGEDGNGTIMRDGKFFRSVGPNCWDPDLRIREYAEHGIDVQVISTVPVMFSYWGEPQHTLELARFLNDHVGEICRHYPRNYIGLGTVPLQAPDMAIAEMARCKELGLPGIQIGSHVNDWNLEDEHLFPFFQAAEDLGMALLVHPWDMMGRKEMPKYWLPWLVGMPAELSRAICSMIFGGVFERLPKLRVCFAHGGGAFPATIGRIEHGFLMRPDLVAVDNPVNPRQYLGRFYVDSVVHDPLALKYLLDVMGHNAVALGTDYPFPLGEQKPGNLIEGMDVDDTVRRRLYFGTALEWLGLNLARFEAA